MSRCGLMLKMLLCRFYFFYLALVYTSPVPQLKECLNYCWILMTFWCAAKTNLSCRSPVWLFRCMIFRRVTVSLYQTSFTLFLLYYLVGIMFDQYYHVFFSFHDMIFIPMAWLEFAIPHATVFFFNSDEILFRSSCI